MGAEGAGKLVGVGILVLVVAAVVVLMGLSALVRDVPETLSDLPLSDHAANKHWEETYHAGNLPHIWDDDLCIRKKVVYCPGTDRMKFLCEVAPDEWCGIVIGFYGPTPEIVTAFEGLEPTYWLDDVKDGCWPPVVTP